MAIAETISSNWRSLVAITASVSVAGMGFGFSYPVITLTMERWGTPEVIIGLNAGMFALSALLFSPLVPRLLSRFGAVTFLIACIVDIVICLLLFKAVNNMVLLFPLRFLAGCGINGLFVATDVWISQLANDANRGRIIAIYSTCLTAGFVIGPMLLLVTGTDGWLPFLSGAGLVALATIPILFVIGREPKFEQTTVAATFQYLKLAPTLVSAGLMFGLLEASMFGFFPIFGMRL